jgi:CheY-like chemotaxis protein
MLGFEMIASSDASQTRSEPPTVLIVDDEPAIVDLLSQLLEDEGFRVVSAGDGLAAWETAQKLRPDLVIADVMMPRMDGFTLVDRLSDGEHPVPVILMSAAVESRRQGVPFIAKPFDLGELLDLVNSHIG